MRWLIQSNLSSSNTDGSFTIADSNSFLSPYEILPIAKTKQMFMEMFLFNHKVACCVRLIEAILMSTLNIHYCVD